MAGNVFINYRRGDEPAAAGRLLDLLERSFPPERLFLDVDSIPPGRDFAKELEIKVEACDVLLAVIGQNWLGARDASGALRLQDPKDFVHIEIATALRLDKRVIPVLVNDAQMPRTQDLPEPLQPLAYRNAVCLAPFADSDGLAGSATAGGSSSRRLVVFGGGAAATAAAVAGVLRVTRQQPGNGGDKPANTAGSAKPPREAFVAPAQPPSAEPPRLDAAAGGRSAKTFKAGSPVTALAVAQKGSRALVGTAARGLQLWDLSAGKSIESFDDPAKAVQTVAVARDGRIAVSSNANESLMLWDLSGAPRGRQPSHKRTRPRRRAAPAAGVRVIRIFRPWTGDSVLALALSPDGKTALRGSSDATLEIWDTASGTLVRRLVGQSDQLTCVAYAADGRTALSGSRDSTIRLWDLATGASLEDFAGHQGAVRAVAFSPDGRFVLSGGEDRTVRLWDIAKARPLRVYRGTVPRSLAWRSHRMDATACPAAGIQRFVCGMSTTAALCRPTRGARERSPASACRAWATRSWLAAMTVR